MPRTDEDTMQADLTTFNNGVRESALADVTSGADNYGRYVGAQKKEAEAAAQAELDAFNNRPPPSPQECQQVGALVGPPGFGTTPSSDAEPEKDSTT